MCSDSLYFYFLSYNKPIELPDIPVRSAEVINPFFGKWEKLREQRNRAARNYYRRNSGEILLKLKNKYKSNKRKLSDYIADNDEKKETRLTSN